MPINVVLSRKSQSGKEEPIDLSGGGQQDPQRIRSNIIYEAVTHTLANCDAAFIVKSQTYIARKNDYNAAQFLTYIHGAHRFSKHIDVEGMSVYPGDVVYIVQGSYEDAADVIKNGGSVNGLEIDWGAWCSDWGYERCRKRPKSLSVSFELCETKGENIGSSAEVKE